MTQQGNMTQAQQREYDKAVEALLGVLGPMEIEDVISVITGFLLGRPDVTMEDVDSLYSRVIHAKVMERLNREG